MCVCVCVPARRVCEAGDYIVVGSRGGRYAMKAASFEARYETAADSLRSPTDDALAAEGFCHYRPTGQVLALALGTNEVARYFPTGSFMGKWGGFVKVSDGDMLVMPYPTGGEVGHGRAVERAHSCLAAIPQYDRGKAPERRLTAERIN